MTILAGQDERAHDVTPGQERPIAILHLEDSPLDAELIRERLQRDGVRCNIRYASGREGFERALMEGTFELILCDYNLPDYDGLEALRHVRATLPDTPVIIISGTVGEAEAVNCLHAGATDYVLKGRIERLVPAVTRAFRDADERRVRARAEEALRQRERRLSSIYDAVADVLVYLEIEPDGGYRVMSVNRTFTQATGLPGNCVVGKRLEGLLSGDQLDAVLARCDESVRERRIVRWEQTAERDGDAVIGEVSLAPVFDDAGICSHLVAAVHDVTEQRRLEGMLRQAQKMESVGLLAGGIAHDFNNLLTVINSLAEFALEEIPAEQPQLQADLREIGAAGARAAALTRQLLAFSRKQLLQPRHIDLNGVVADLGGFLRRLLGEDITITIAVADRPVTVLADVSQIEQVITNLAVNSRDAMPTGGTLTFGTRLIEIAETGRRSSGLEVPPGRYAVLEIRDTGTGMDEATRRRIFEPFFTTKGPTKGTGLGLATVYGIVQQSNGCIDVESAVGAGTCFTIYLPYVQEGSDAACAADARTRGGREAILVVEDVGEVRALVARTLSAQGYEVLAAASGEEAVRLVEGRDEPVHLVLTDVVMPGMGGRELAQHLQRIRPGIKVLYMSGYTDDVIIRHGLEGGVSLLAKPFNPTDLSHAIRQRLDA